MPGVTAVALVGSRAEGDATPLSDWDYSVETTDFEATAGAIEELSTAGEPLAAQWDPFPADVTFMLLLPGATKVDFIFRGVQPQPRGPWRPGIDAPDAIEAHFWDWLLWLGSKQLRGEGELVASELSKMYDLLLEPLGAAHPPATLAEAAGGFLAWRSIEASQGRLPPGSALAEDILPAMRQAGVL